MRPQDWEHLPWPARQRLQRQALKRYQAAQDSTEQVERVESSQIGKRAAKKRHRQRKSDLVERCRGCGAWTWRDQACTACTILTETRDLPSSREAQHPDEAHRPTETQEREDSQGVPHTAGTTGR